MYLHDVLYGSQNKQRLFPYTALADCFRLLLEKLRKATTSFVVFVCSHAATRLPLEEFS